MLPPKGRKRWGLWLFLGSALIASAALAVLYSSIHETNRVREYRAATEIWQSLHASKVSPSEFRERVERAIVLADTAQAKMEGSQAAVLRARLYGLKMEFESAVAVLDRLPERPVEAVQDYGWYLFMKWVHLHCQKSLDSFERACVDQVSRRIVDILQLQPDLVSRAILALVRGDMVEALKLSDSLSADYRSEVVRAAALMRHGDYDGGLSHAQQAVKLSPNALEAQLLEASALRFKGEAKASEEKFAALVEYVPTSSLLRHLLGLVRLQQNKLEAALQEFQRALVIDPGWKPAALAAAWTQSSLGRHDAALELLKGLTADTSYPEAWQERARVLRRAGRLQEALAAIDQMLAAFPALGRQSRHHVDRAELLIEAKRREEALAALDRAKELEPDSLRVRRLRVDLLEALGRSDQWMTELSELLTRCADAALYLKRAKVRLARGQFDEAAADAGEVLKLDPELATEALMVRARAHEGTGRFGEALADYDQVIKRVEKPRLDAHRGRGMMNFRLGRYVEATLDLMAVAMIDESDGEACEVCGDAFRLQAKPDLEQAIVYYTRAVSRGRRSAELFRKRGECKFALKQYESAVEDFRKSAELAPEAPTWVLLGRSLILVGQAAEAFEPFDRAARLDDRNAEAFFFRGMVRHFTRGESKEAVEDITRGIGLGYFNTHAFLTRAMCHEALGNVEEAIQDATNAIRLDDKNGQAYSLRARLFLTQRKFDQALADAETGLSSHPDSFDLHYTRAISARMVKKFELCVSSLDRAIALRPQRDDLLSMKGWVQVEMGDLEGAERSFAGAISVNPNQPVHYSDRAGVLLQLNRLDEALADATHSLKISPENASAHYVAACVHRRQGRPAAALDHLAHAVALAPEQTAWWMELAQWRFEAGDLASAQQAVERVLQAEPNNYEAVVLAGQILGERKEYPAAIDRFTRAVSTNPARGEAYLYRAMAAMGLENYAQALEDLRRARELLPQRQGFIDELIDACRACGEF